ncbi:MAG TPA: HlyD family efflux transporter periplasmic adaptor subunit [Bryobacteraceae bacterium]|nr:HlyD family efflux transporter periplasmic adaptor subunit [Bryobacteraceae bacterium]
MKTKTKIVILLGALVLAGVGIYASTVYARRGVVTVQTARVVRQDLVSQVTASGEIKPKEYINIGASAMGTISEVLVKEGDRVRKGQLLAKIEDVQPAADVRAQQAALSSAEADSAAAEAGVAAADEAIRTAQADIDKNKADLARMKSDFDRAASLYKDQLLALQDYELKKSTYEGQQALVRESEAKLVQAKAQREQTAAQLASAQRRVAQARATLARYSDVLQKYNAYAPRDGVITDLPVRVGETVVPGIQNSAASTIMTLADTSLITAELRVDEADIVNVKLNQPADITIDAIPNRTFHGHVTDIGNMALVRSTGQVASQSAVSSQEAKDFKVVIVIDNPPEEARPGLSCTAKITTATHRNVLTIPIQALTVRRRGDLEKKPEKGSAQAAAAIDPVLEKQRKEEIQGVFVVSNGKAEFHKVDTGITGTTDIEVVDGLKAGDEIVIGSYQVIRTLRNQAGVQVDNRAQQQSS